MKKGFVFTVVFSLFFLMLLYAAAAYINTLEARNAALDSADSGREAYFADDVGYDYLSVWGMKTSMTRDSRLHWTIEEKISPSYDVDGAISSYEDFIANDYSKANNINAKAELDRSGELRLEPIGIVYRHSSGNDIEIDGASEGYLIKAMLGKACAGGCSLAGDWVWGSAGDGPYISLDILDANGSRVDIMGKTSGYVKLNGTSSAYANLENGGGVGITVSGGQFRIGFSNTGADVKTTITTEGTGPAKVYAPVKLSIGDRKFERIALIEK